MFLSRIIILFGSFICVQGYLNLYLDKEETYRLLGKFVQHFGFITKIELIRDCRDVTDVVTPNGVTKSFVFILIHVLLLLLQTPVFCVY